MNVTDGGAALEQRMRAAGGYPAVAHSCQPATDILARVGDKWSVLVVILLGPISALGAWAFGHREAIDAARLAYDVKNAAVQD